MIKCSLILVFILSAISFAFSEGFKSSGYNFDYNLLKKLTKQAETEKPATISDIISSTREYNSIGLNFLNVKSKEIQRITPELFHTDKLLSNDTLIVGVAPYDSLIIDKEFNYSGTILIALNGKMIIRNTKATLLGDIILFNNGSLTIENSIVSFPQRYFYERTIFATGESKIIIKNSTLDFSGLSHTLAVANNARADIQNITNLGFTTTGLYGKGIIAIDGSNEAGEFVMTDSTNLSIKNAKTALLWHNISEGQKFEMTFPKGDSVKAYSCNNKTAGVSGISFSVDIENCKNVMWGLMPVSGSEVKIKNSEIRAIGLWLRNNLRDSLNGLVDNTKYSDFSPNLKDIKLNLQNTSVQTWSIYTYDLSEINITGSIVGEIGAMGKSKVVASKMFCDGSGGYVWGTDTTFSIYGFSTATASVRAQGNGIFILAYSALTMGQATAVGNSVLMVVQSSLPEEPKPYNNACVWYANIEKPTTANVDSKVAVIGSVWILKTATSKLMDFAYYRMYYRKNESDPWTQISGKFNSEKRHDTLCVWNAAGLSIGNYILKMVISDNFGDSVDVVSSVNLLPSSMEVSSESKLDELKIYPDPATDFICVELNNEIILKDLRIIDIFGREFSFSFVSESGTILKFNLSDFPAGIYFLKSGNKVIKKFIKK